MAKKNTPVDPLVAALMPESDKKMATIAGASVLVALALSFWASMYEVVVDEVIFDSSEGPDLTAQMTMDEKKEEKKEEKKKEEPKKPRKKAGGGGKPRGKGQPNAPQTRGVLKLLTAQTKNASAGAYDLMKNQKFTKDIDKVLKDVAGLQTTGKTVLGGRRGKADGGFNEGYAEGGAGGEEAALFAGSLFRMYSMYAESKRWHIDITNANETELGGYKEISFMIEGSGAYSRFKYESGVHRVQRVPDTETQGRIHTSTVTVAVLPEADDVELEINPADLKIDTFRSSGAGGQHINKTSSAIRVTHIPTGTVVECQDERSQFKNKDKALKILRSRLLDEEQRKHDEAIASDRKNQVGTGDRSERIRTYNYPQGRVTDHRIGLTLYKLEQILNGDMTEVVDALITYYRTEALKSEEEA